MESSAPLNKPSIIAAPLPVFRLIGILFIVAAAAIAIFILCPTKGQYFIIYTLTGVGIALLLAKSADKSTASFKIRNFTVALAGGVALPFILFVTNPIGAFKSDGCELPVSLTVFVHGKKGPQDLVLRQQGYVIMDVKKEKRRSSINENGEAHFENLHPGDRVLLNIDFSEPYKALYPDSQYVINEESAIYLPIALEGIDKVKGTVFYDDSFLPGVTVKIDDLISTTNQFGDFTIYIPEAMQAKQYEVWFAKEGFLTKSYPAFPQTKPMQIVMEQRLKQQ